MTRTRPFLSLLLVIACVAAAGCGEKEEKLGPSSADRRSR